RPVNPANLCMARVNVGFPSCSRILHDLDSGIIGVAFHQLAKNASRRGRGQVDGVASFTEGNIGSFEKAAQPMMALQPESVSGQAAGLLYRQVLLPMRSYPQSFFEQMEQSNASYELNFDNQPELNVACKPVQGRHEDR